MDLANNTNKREDSKRRTAGQNCLQEKYRKNGKTVFQIGEAETRPLFVQRAFN